MVSLAAQAVQTAFRLQTLDILSSSMGQGLPGLSTLSFIGPSLVMRVNCSWRWKLQSPRLRHISRRVTSFLVVPRSSTYLHCYSFIVNRSSDTVDHVSFPTSYGVQ
jgi:hypothetical protein